jgi:hypothetical protein
MMKIFNGGAATELLIVAACLANAQTSTDFEIKRAYKNLIDAENRHDLAAVKGMVWDSPRLRCYSWQKRPSDGADRRSGPAFSPRRLCSCSSVSPGPGCGRHIHHPGSEKLQPESLVIKPLRRNGTGGLGSF